MHGLWLSLDFVEGLPFPLSSQPEKIRFGFLSTKRIKVKEENEELAISIA